jgi:UDP-N-acetylmuramoylalanine--D-glutamate ligase
LQHRVKAGACLIDGQITLVEDGRAIPVCPVEAIKLRGEHNCYNVLAACAIAHAAGAAPEAMAEVVTTFSGVSHRLEVVARQSGVTYINDSIATSPERLIAALKAFSEPIILLAGGKDKDLPWDEAAQLILERVKYLVLFGHAQDLIMKVVTQERKSTDTLQIHSCHTLEEAVVRAKNLAQPGDMVLLSPGCTSYDAYPDFAARGEHFRELVNN